MEIRPMMAGDAANIAHLDVQAFSSYWQDALGQANIPPRTQANILACLDLNPAGCLVAVEQEPVGYVFSRVWGQVGWVGTFGVHPDFRGRGVGKSLLLAAVEQLKAAGCRTIGLETMPDSAYNIGFYTRLGFRLVQPSLSLDKTTGEPARDPGYRLLCLPDQPADLTILSQISQASRPGLDLAVEAQNAAAFGWGTSLLIGKPEPWAAAILRTVPKRELVSESYCEVRSLVVHPASQGCFREALQAVEAFAASRSLLEINLHINAVHSQALREALEAGYRVSYALLRMILLSDATSPPGIDLSRWAM